MDINTAQKFLDGKITLEELNPTIGESLQLMLNGCLEDNGEITCLICGRPNECCECGYEGQY